MIRQNDEPVDLFWGSCRHCSDNAIGAEIVDRKAIVSEDSGSVDVSYQEFGGHKEIRRVRGWMHSYTVSSGVMYRADFSWCGGEIGDAGTERFRR
jgi:hypothetical protein